MKTIAIIGLIFFAGYASAETSFRTDSFVKMIEQQYGMFPGQTRVLPQCGCTVKLLGTKISGHVYTVYLDKLD